MSSLPLVFTATPVDSVAKLGMSVTVQVALRSAATEPIWVNKRMGMGYEDSLIRELFCTIRDESTGRPLPVSEDERVDAHRLPPTRKDFEQLRPGEEVTAVVNLATWHPFRQPGVYRVELIYENQFDGHEFGLQAFTGAVRAEPVTIKLE